ncbi:flagellar attachment zone protein 1-like isoform X4 [Dreissena polymorpha]|uniref:flagellar attachment zone protein 1-like isoform X4 n=1 Tax=Dreissena polymorpha TaxID=45954 RepID=UPI0022649C1B|nr:flagellar attachment zone protein 1-like isoform X4 [Dreissena polymorpha]
MSFGSEKMVSENYMISSVKEELSSKNYKISSENDTMSFESDTITSAKEKVSTENDKIASENDKISSVKEEVSSENDKIASENDTISYVKEEVSSENDKISSEDMMSSENGKISSAKNKRSSVKGKRSSVKGKRSSAKDKRSSGNGKISSGKDMASENGKISDEKGKRLSVKGKRSTKRKISSVKEESSSETESESDDMTKCSCKRHCLEQFTKSDIEDHILSMQDLDKHEKEMFILESIEQSTPTRTRTGIRKRIRYRFMFDGKVVCRPIFCYLNGIGKKSLSSIQAHVNKNGFVPRVHGNRGRKPHNALQYNDIEYCVDFLIRYVESHGQPMTAEPKSQEKEIPILLPAGLTKVIVHREYEKACQESKRRVLGIGSFRSVWRSCIPHVKISNPKEEMS